MIMGLRSIFTNQTETIQDLITAAEARYWDGLELMTTGHPDAGIYLMGYSAEMLLKSACFFFDEAKPSDVVKPRLPPTRRLVPNNIPHESYHSLEFWYYVLVYKRQNASRPLSQQIATPLNRSVIRLHQTWWVEMRYRPARARDIDVTHTFEDVSWLRAHYLDLWS